MSKSKKEEKQKILEKNDFKLFCRSFNDPGIDFIRFGCCKKGEPDIVARYNGEEIGVEHTEFNHFDIKGNLISQDQWSYRAIESSQIKFQNFFESILNESALNGFHISVGLHNEGVFCDKKKRERLAKLLLCFLIDNPLEDEYYCFEENDLSEELRDEFCVFSVSYYKTDSLKNEYDRSGAGFLPMCYSSSIQYALDKKERKILRYEASFSKKWLLIVANSEMSSLISDSFEDQEFHKTYKSSFDRAFLLNKFGRSCVELKLHPNG